MNVIHSLRIDAAQWGWTSALLARVFTRLQRHLGFRLFRCNVRPFPARPADPALPPGITLRVLRLEELLEGAADPELELEADFARDALARGDLAVGAFEGGRLVAYSWRTASIAPFEDGLWVRIARPYHYIYKSFTLPSHRGRRIHTALTRLADRYSVETGHVAELGLIEMSNMESLRAARSLGRRKVGYVALWMALGRRLTLRTAGLRRIGADFFLPQAAAAASRGQAASPFPRSATPV